MDAFWDYHSHDVYREDTFLEPFIGDLEKAKGLVIVQSPFLTVRRLEQLQPAITKCIRRGIRFCVLAQARDDRFPNDGSAARTEAGAEKLFSLGAHVTMRPAVHEKLAVIDETILWEASINVLSHRDTSERVNRYCGRIHVEKAIKGHNLYSCSTCSAIPGFGFPSPEELMLIQMQQIGKEIAARRVDFRWSQVRLAKESGVDRTVISEIEAGTRDAKLTTLARLYQVLNLRMHSLPTFLMPKIHPTIDKGRRIECAITCTRTERERA